MEEETFRRNYRLLLNGGIKNNMRILNCYSGIGGNRKLWENHDITAVENNPKIADIYQDFFPSDKIVFGDAHQYLLENYKEFDFMLSSPPCQSHSSFRHNICVRYRGTEPIYPDMNLYQEILFLKHHFKGKWVVENVKPYYKPLITPQYIGRHTFWTNFYITPIKVDYDIGTMNRQASKEKQRKAIIREAQIPEFLTLHDLKDFKLPNKRQVLRNCVLPKIGLHILNESKRDIQPELFRR